MKPDFDYNYATDHPIGVKIADNAVWVTLADGRVIGNPLDWHPWLEKAVREIPEKLISIELDAFSVVWPDLDEGLDIEGMLRGIKSRQPQPTETSA
jgi:hypothetical protein